MLGVRELAIVCKLLFCFILLFAFDTSMASASEDAAVHYGTPSSINEYSRPGARAGTYKDGYSAEFNVQCARSGSWSVLARGLCYEAGSDSCSCNTGCDSDSCYKNWGNRGARASDLRVRRIHRCRSGVCLNEVSDPPGRAGHPEIGMYRGDPQLYVMPGGDGFVEFMTSYDEKSVKSSHWIKIAGNAPLNLSIPTKKRDFLSFINSSSSYVQRAERACVPVKLSTRCPSPPSCSCSCSPCPDDDD